MASNDNPRNCQIRADLLLIAKVAKQRGDFDFPPPFNPLETTQGLPPPRPINFAPLKAVPGQTAYFYRRVRRFPTNRLFFSRNDTQVVPYNPTSSTASETEGCRGHSRMSRGRFLNRPYGLLSTSFCRVRCPHRTALNIAGGCRHPPLRFPPHPSCFATHLSRCGSVTSRV